MDGRSIRRTVGEERNWEVGAGHKAGERAAKNLRRDVGVDRGVVIVVERRWVSSLPFPAYDTTGSLDEELRD